MSETPRPTVLLVEEEADERGFIAELLARAGYEPLAAQDSDAALALLETREALDALVVDAHVPGRIDGYELAALVRERRPRIGVVMMSGHSDETSGPLPEGALFVAKAYVTDRLVRALDELTGRR